MFTTYFELVCHLSKTRNLTQIANASKQCPLDCVNKFEDASC